MLLLLCHCSLHESGQRWVPIIDCGIPVADDDAAYQEGLAAGVFIKDLSGKPYMGQVGQQQGSGLGS
jgi:alpha-D-xyloside xylohydrolase